MGSIAAIRQPSVPVVAVLPVAVGLLAMYVPTFLDVSRVYWANERGSAGPMILAISAWLLWRVRDRLLGASDRGALPVAGSVLLAFGLALYAIGRSQDFPQLEVGSMVPVLAGMVLGLRGVAGLRAAWFPLLFLVFVVPIPGSLLDAILVPLKQQVSVAAEWIMYTLGFPVARTGVVLTVGPYQLLIADACSGLNSMISLTGVGLVYVHTAGHASRLHNLALLSLVLPIAFVANIVRVCLLMWVTFEFGDIAGQRFHDWAGYLEIVLAFALFFGLDALFGAAGRLVGRVAGTRTAEARP
ncbi:MAG: exosortase B [Burkholderiales bacterium]